MAVIERNLGDIGSFLECWDSIQSKERTAFIQNKSLELISKWLTEATTTGSAMTEAIINTCVKEIEGIIESKECPLRYVQWTSSSNMCNCPGTN
jgi:predicted metal-dependent peptidase